MIDVTDLIWRECNLLMAVRWDLDKVKGGRYANTMPCSPVQCGAELRADFLDGGESDACIREIRNEVMPEDVSHLMRHKGTAELRLQPCEMMTERGETLGIGGMKLGLHSDKLINDLYQGSIGKVKSEEAVLGLAEIRKETAVGIRQVMPMRRARR